MEPGYLITDDGELPNDWYAMINTSYYRSMIFEYILLNLKQSAMEYSLDYKAHVFNDAKEGKLYVSQPFSSRTFYDTTVTDGSVCEYTIPSDKSLVFNKAVMTRSGEKRARSDDDIFTFPEQGEGDIICKLFTDAFTHVFPDDIHVVRSKDLDMLAIYSAGPCTGKVHVHIGNIKEKGKTLYEFINISILWSSLYKNNINLGLSYTYVLILAGTDYCEGVFGIGGCTLFTRFMSCKEEIVKLKDNQLTLNQVALGKILYKTKAKTPANLNVGMKMRAQWNLLYWYNIMSQPEVNKGWKKARGGNYLALK